MISTTTDFRRAFSSASRSSRTLALIGACHKYGFHALRRGYATMNVDRLPAAVLQKKMRHNSFETTLGYIKLAEKMQQTTDKVYVPELLERKTN